jgi:hypothetical protein
MPPVRVYECTVVDTSRTPTAAGRARPARPRAPVRGPGWWSAAGRVPAAQGGRDPCQGGTPRPGPPSGPGPAAVAGGSDLAGVGPVREPSSTGRTALDLGRQTSSAPVACAWRHRSAPTNSRSASSTISVPTTPVCSSSRARVVSPRASGPMAAPSSTCAPHSATPTSRTCGTAVCSPDGSLAAQRSGRWRGDRPGPGRFRRSRPPASPETTPPRLGGGQRPGNLGEQPRQRLGTQPRPGLGDRRGRRDPAPLLPAPGPAQPPASSRATCW